MGADNLPSTHRLFLPGVYRLWAGHREDNCRRGRKKRDGEGAQDGEAPERGCKLGESGGNTIQLGQTLRPRPHPRIHGLPLWPSTPMTCHSPNQAVTRPGFPLRFLPPGMSCPPGSAAGFTPHTFLFLPSACPLPSPHGC